MPAPERGLFLARVPGPAAGLARRLRVRAQRTDHAACGMHGSWKALRSRIMEYRGQTTIADLLKAPDDRRKAVGKTRRRKGVGSAGT